MPKHAILCITADPNDNWIVGGDDGDSIERFYRMCLERGANEVDSLYKKPVYRVVARLKPSRAAYRHFCRRSAT